MFVLTVSSVYAVTFSGDVPYTTLTFSGYTSPEGYVEITQSGNTIGTTTADTQGNFSYEISDLATSGEQTYEIFSQDVKNNKTSIEEENIDITAHQDNEISNITLSPTITLSGSTLSGYAYADSSITLYDHTAVYAQLSADNSGYWQDILQESNFGSAEQQFSVKWDSTGGMTSQVSEIISSTFTTPTLSMTPSPLASETPAVSLTPTITTTSSPTITPTQQAAQSHHTNATSLTSVIAEIKTVVSNTAHTMYIFAYNSALPVESFAFGLALILFLPEEKDTDPQTQHVRYVHRLHRIKNIALIIACLLSMIYFTQQKSVITAGLVLVFPFLYLLGRIMHRQ